MSILPNHSEAFIDIDKLKNFSLNPFHPTGKNKAKVFKSALDLTIADASFLKESILRELSSNDAILGRTDQYGKRHTVDIKIRKLK